MGHLFSALTSALSGSPAAASAASFTWGVLSILLSPCHLSGLVLIMAFIGGLKDPTLKKAFTGSLLFALGVFMTVVFIGLMTSLAGRMAGDLGTTGNIILKAVFLVIFAVLGLYLLNLFDLPFLNIIRQERFASRSASAAFILGLLFGLGVGPCTFAFMAPVLGIVFETARSNPGNSILLVLFFATGQCGVIIAAGTSVKLVQRYLDWDKKAGLLKGIRIALGILFLLIAAYFGYSIWKSF